MFNSKAALLSALLATTALFSTSVLAADPVRIGIANFGEDPALNQAVEGFKRAITEAGYVEGEDVVYSISHTNFDSSLVPQMVTKLASENPALIYTLTTPVSQIAKQTLAGSVPIVFGVVTDPVAAKLVPSWEAGDVGITGAADKMDMGAVMEFAHQFVPEAKTFGLPYNPGEANDVALLEVVTAAAPAADFEVVSVGVDSVNDIQQRITSLQGKADVIYLPTSNLLQPAVNAVASSAMQAGIPVINSNDLPVMEGVVPASFAVSYEQVGFNAGNIAVQILEGADPQSIPPHKPTAADHKAVISKRGLEAFGMELPASLADCDCIVD